MCSFVFPERGSHEVKLRDLCPWMRLLPSGKRVRSSLTLNQFVKFKALGQRKDACKEREGLRIQNAKYRGVRQRKWGKWVAEIRQPNGGERLWLGTFANSLEAAHAYDNAVRAMFGSCARLNFLESCSTPAGLDSTKTSNNSVVFAVHESTSVSPSLRNEDVESIALADNEAPSVENIAHISPNVKNEAAKGELRANTQHSVVAETNSVRGMIQEDLTCHFMDEDGIFDLDDIPRHFNDDCFSGIESLFTFDFDSGHLGFLGDDQCGQLQNPNDKLLVF
jgi:hypothetical protein